jgi:hypothetical protein
MKIAKFLTDQGEVLIEVPEDKHVTTTSGMKDVSLKTTTEAIVQATKLSLEQSLSGITTVGNTILQKLKPLEPADIEVEFGVTFSAGAGAIITSIAGEATIKIKMSWKQKEKTNVPGASQSAG